MSFSNSNTNIASEDTTPRRSLSSSSTSHDLECLQEINRADGAVSLQSGERTLVNNHPPPISAISLEEIIPEINDCPIPLSHAMGEGLVDLPWKKKTRGEISLEASPLTDEDDAPVPFSQYQSSSVFESKLDKKRKAQGPTGQKQQNYPFTQGYDRSTEEIDIVRSVPPSVAIGNRAGDQDLQRIGEILECSNDDHTPPMDENDNDNNSSENQSDNESAIHSDNEMNDADDDADDDADEETAIPQEGDSSTVIVPTAFLVEEEIPNASSSSSPNTLGGNHGTFGADFDVVHAEPIPQFWKQRRTKLLLGILFLVLIASSVAIGFSFSSNGNSSSNSNNNNPIVAQNLDFASPSSFPSFNNTLTNQLTTPPSWSQAPSHIPTSFPSQFPTTIPTGIPSSSQAPSHNPTSCAMKIASQYTQSMELEVLDAYGAAVGLHGRHAIISTGSGYVAFFSLRDGEWVRTNVVDVIDDVSDYTDPRVDISNDVAVVGYPWAATMDDFDPMFEGLVYVYRRNKHTGIWMQDGDALRPQHVSGDCGANFGHSVHVIVPSRPSEDGDRIVVGAPAENNFGGSVYIFEYDATERTKEWLLVEKMPPVPNLSHDDWSYFGLNTAVYETMIAITLLCGDDDCIFIYDYERESSDLIPLREILQDYFGMNDIPIDAVSMSKDFLVLCSYSHGVYIYEIQRDNNETKFTLNQIVNASDYGDLDFGSKIVLDNDILIVAGIDTVYVFTLTNNGYWKESLTFEIPDVTWENGGEYSIDASGRRVLAASDFNAYAFQLDECTQPLPTMVPSSSFGPSDIPSVRPSMTLRPSLMPSLSEGPSKSSLPSQRPSASFVPTITCHWIDIHILFDSNPSSTSWSIIKIDLSTDETTTIDLVTSYSYSLANKYHIESRCLEEGHYAFSIYDIYGAGLCCSGGQGHYNVTYRDGESLIGEGGQFEFIEIIEFDIPFFTSLII